jgi:hypothetical protein
VIYVGIDPGKKGFLAAVDEHGKDVGSWVQPLIGKGTKGNNFDVGAMRRILVELAEKHGDVMVLLEELSPMGGMGTPQTHFYQGMGFALWIGVAAGLGIPCRLMTKQALKKVLGIPTPKRIPRAPALPKKATKAEKKEWAKKDRARLTRYGKQKKAEAIKVAKQLMPGIDFRRTPRCDGPDDNKAEAYLYAVALLRTAAPVHITPRGLLFGG